MSKGHVQLYGHIYKRLDEYKEEDETYSEAVERLLPWQGEVIEFALADRKTVEVESEVHAELKATAGQNVSMPQVIDQYLIEAGYPHDGEEMRRTELQGVDN